MKKIRKNVFETNSSSTHSFTISNNYPNIKFPIHIHPDWYGEFGWEWETWDSTEEKMAYLLRCLVAYNYEWSTNQDKQMESVYKAIKPFKERLEDLEITFDLPSYEEWENGYVDHEDWYQIRMKEIFEDDDELIKFLFNDESYIEGGNDNG